MRTVPSLFYLAASFCLTAAIFAPVGRADIYNAVTDFSSASNPNGVWSYEADGTLFPLIDGSSGSCGSSSGIQCLYWSNGLGIPDNVSIKRLRARERGKRVRIG